MLLLTPILFSTHNHIFLFQLYHPHSHFFSRAFFMGSVLQSAFFTSHKITNLSQTFPAISTSTADDDVVVVMGMPSSSPCYCRRPLPRLTSLPLSSSSITVIVTQIQSRSQIWVLSLSAPIFCLTRVSAIALTWLIDYILDWMADWRGYVWLLKIIRIGYYSELSCLTWLTDWWLVDLL